MRNLRSVDVRVRGSCAWGLRSYSLWYKYLEERVRAVKKTSPTDPARKEVNAVFERAMVFMHKVRVLRWS